MTKLRSLEFRILFLLVIAAAVFGLAFGPGPVYADDEEPETPVSKMDPCLHGSVGNPSYLGWLDPELDCGAKTDISYENLTPDIIRIDEENKVIELLKPGKARFMVRAEETEEYAYAERLVQFDVKICRPYLKKIRKNGATRLNWTYTPGAVEYQLFIKYPGSKKFKLAARRPANVRSVLHKGLTKGKVYQYKLRIIVEKNGKRYKGPFSKVRIRKVR